MSARLLDGTQAVLAAYQAARLDAMAERAFSYEELSASAVCQALKRGLESLGGHFFRA